MGVFCVVILAGLLAFTQASHFEGGTIYWKVLSGANVQFDWSQGWRLTAGPCGSGCSTASIGFLSANSAGSWTCISGCSGNVGPVQYTVTGVNTVENWEQGVNSFTYNFGATGSYTVGFTGNAWRSLNYGTGGNWAIQTEINLGTRSDTGSDNASPLTAFSPIYRLQFGCSAETIMIPMLDPNGDAVSCRWASSTAECASVCNSLPAATLSSFGALCTITVQTSNAAYTSGGWYAGAVQLDDFPGTSITMGSNTYSSLTRLSTVPVQFLVYTPGMTVSCGSYPTFVSPTAAANHQFSISTGGSISVTVKAQSVNSGASITSITPAGPAGGVSTSLSGGQITYNWTPSSSQTGGFNLCFTAQDTIGKTATRCFSIAVAVQCTDPGTPAGVTRTASSGPPFYYGDVITHTCPIGHEVTSGNAIRTCQLSSSFDGSAPACSKVSCGNPNGHNNATQTGSSYVYQDVVSWSCNSGYERTSGDFVIQCAANKQWNGTALQCTRVSCPAVSAHSNATQTGFAFRYLDSVRWACHTGYEPDTGNSTIQCQASKGWSGSPLTCKRITCSSIITSHNNATQIGTGNRYLDVLSWTCNTGYERLSGDNAISCQANTAWNGTKLLCHRKNCTSTPPYVSNSSSVHTDDRYLGQIIYTVDLGYMVASGPRAGLNDSTHVCQANQTWTGTWPSMIRVPCNLTEPKNTHIKTSSPSGRAGHASPGSLVWRYLDSVEWECDTGYAQTGGNKFQACRANRAFNGTGMNCTDIDECISGPCQNGGNCLNTIGLFTCACVNGYTGTLCQIAPTLSPSMQAIIGTGGATGATGGAGSIGTATIGTALGTGTGGVGTGTLQAALGIAPSAGTHVSGSMCSLLVGILLAAAMRLR